MSLTHLQRLPQMPGSAFNAAQLAVIGDDGQLPKLDLAYLLRYYAESHVGIPVVLQVLVKSRTCKDPDTQEPKAKLPRFPVAD